MVGPVVEVEVPVAGTPDEPPAEDTGADDALE
jgi:hypothetical protein